MEPADYARFASWQDDARIRKWNLWGYVDARDVATAVRLAVEGHTTGAEVCIVAAADTVMTRDSAELLAEVFPEVPTRRAIAGRETLLAIERAPRAARLRTGAQLARRAVTVVAADVGPLEPWAEPELIARGRLPMHAVPHLDRVALDGTWRFQLLHAPDEPLSRRLGRDPGPGRLDDAGHLGPPALHERQRRGGPRHAHRPPPPRS